MKWINVNIICEYWGIDVKNEIEYNVCELNERREKV
jgi:hypothetical protein